MSTRDASSPPPENSSVADKLTAETQRKRRLIRDSLWPPARLFAEILYDQINSALTFTHAAALTYKTLFSLLPIFVLSLLVLSMISAGSGENALDVTVKRLMFEQLSIDKIQLTDKKGEPMVNADGEPVTLARFAERTIEKAKGSVNTKLTGLVAFGILVYGALTLMIVIESTFNQIYGAAKSRSWPRRIMLYWCVLTMGPIGIAASIVLGNSAYTKASSYVGTGNIAWTLMPLQVVTGILVSFILVVLMYRLIPGTQVKWKSAILGGAVGAVLWELSKWGFGMYVHWSVRGANWYGPFIMLPLFMLWIYLTWSAILLGLHVAYMHQYYPLLKRRFFFTRMGRSAISDLRWVLPLGVLLFRRFKQGKATYASDAAVALMLPNEATSQLLAALEDAGLVHVTRSGGYTLAKPPEAITAFDLLMAVRALAQVPPELAKDRPAPDNYPQISALSALENLESKWAKEHSLASLAGEV